MHTYYQKTRNVSIINNTICMFYGRLQQNLFIGTLVQMKYLSYMYCYCSCLCTGNCENRAIMCCLDNSAIGLCVNTPTPFSTVLYVRCYNVCLCLSICELILVYYNLNIVYNGIKMCFVSRRAAVEMNWCNSLCRLTLNNYLEICCPEAICRDC